MTNLSLSPRAKLAIVLGVLASFGFFIAAFVTFMREGDWPASYVSAGCTILAVMFIAIRRRARRRA